MKTYLVLFALAVLACGCTSTTVESSTLHLKRVSFLQQVEIPELAVETNGVVHLKGYTNDGGNAALKAIVEAAVSAALKSVAP